MSGDLAAPGPPTMSRPGGDRHATGSGPVVSGWSRDSGTLARVLEGLRRL
ncbi:hypothetical protein [Actinopolyspora alba]|nr:hypothetical protein [Actinopolyspora alba]